MLHLTPLFCFQLQQRSLKALGRLMAVLLETEPTGGFFQSIIHVSMCGAREKALCLSIVGTGFWGLRGRSEGEKPPADVPAHCELRNGQRNGPCRGKGRRQPLAGHSRGKAPGLGDKSDCREWEQQQCRCSVRWEATWSNRADLEGKCWERRDRERGGRKGKKRRPH